MEREFFLNAGIPPPLQFESSSSPLMPIWQSLSSATEIQVAELNCSSEISLDCFLNPNLEKSTDQSIQFDSALSSIFSTPVPSNSNDCFLIQELIGKFGNANNSGEILPLLQPSPAGMAAAPPAPTSYITRNNSTRTSCYNTPSNCPPKLNLPVEVDHHLAIENLPKIGSSMPLNSSVAEFSADPGFAERAAKFSCFGSRSFNGRTNQFGVNSSEFSYGSNPLMGDRALPRVSSTPSLKVAGSQMGAHGNMISKLQSGNETEMTPASGSPLVLDKKFSRLSESSTPNQTEFSSSPEASSVSEQNPAGETGQNASNDINSRKRKASRGKTKEPSSSQCTQATKVPKSGDDSNAKRCKPAEGSGTENGVVKTEHRRKRRNSGSGEESENQSKSIPNPAEPPKDYIHVRARRGQATDSHSLAERVRREKISERMKLLQDIVPGCNKVTGKALMLDEIINYVQSLQLQVEFLSMKLASVNFRPEINMETLLQKDTFQTSSTLLRHVYPLDSSAAAFYGHQPQPSPQLQGNIPNGAVTQRPADPLETIVCRNLNAQLHSFEGLSEGVP